MTVAHDTTDQTAAMLEELSRVLWKQRELIDQLQYRLELQQLVLAASRADRLPLALADVEAAMDAIRVVEQQRDAVVRDCAERFGLPDNATITQLRESAPEPWRTVLVDHQQALLAQVAATEQTAAANREFASRGAAALRGVLNEITGNTPTTGYGPSGTATTTSTLIRPALLDREA